MREMTVHASTALRPLYGGLVSRKCWGWIVGTWIIYTSSQFLRHIAKDNSSQVSLTWDEAFLLV